MIRRSKAEAGNRVEQVCDGLRSQSDWVVADRLRVPQNADLSARALERPNGLRRLSRVDEGLPSRVGGR